MVEGSSVSKMAKSYDFQWQVSIPDPLREGATFDRYDEVIYLLYICTNVLAVS